jgi:hypothetical protein
LGSLDLDLNGINADINADNNGSAQIVVTAFGSPEVEYN